MLKIFNELKNESLFKIIFIGKNENATSMRLYITVCTSYHYVAFS